jgi:hypothetical protein
MKKLAFIISALVLLLSACTLQIEENTPAVTPSSTSTTLPTITLSPSLTPTKKPEPTLTFTPTPQSSFSFVVTSDMSHYSAREYYDYPNFFAALLGSVADYGPGDFMISAGDILPAEGASWTIDQMLGTDYPWFPIPGNHDFGQDEIDFFENYQFDINGEEEPNIVNWGPDSCPRTTYSFDYQNAHFVALNVYCNEEAPWGIDGSITDTLYNWLAADLGQTDKDHIFVFGHEPAYPRPDADTGLEYHLGDSLDQYSRDRDRFWGLLQGHNVLAYIHGHTHGYNVEKIDGIWQLGAGQAMGVRAAPSPGTFLIIEVNGEQVTLRTYRGEEGPGFSFFLRDEVVLRQ